MRRLLAVACALLIHLAAGTAASAATLKLGTLAPEGSPWYEVIRDMGEAWKEISDGQINMRIYPGGIAGDEGDMVRKMRIGQLHIAALSGGGLADIAPEIRALQMPMMFRSYDELDYVRERIRPELEAAFEARGFTLLTWGDAGWLYFFTQEPVVGPDDLKALKLFVWTGNTAFVEAWKDLGYQPVPLAATEIHMGLLSGLINAVIVPPIAALSFQWFALANHMTDLKFVPLVGALIISTGTWESFPEEIKPLLLDAAHEAGRRLQEVRHLGAQAIDAMQDYGLLVHPVPPSLVAAWEERARLGYPRIIGAVVPPDLVAKVERLRDEYRASGGGR